MPLLPCRRAGLSLIAELLVIPVNILSTYCNALFLSTACSIAIILVDIFAIFSALVFPADYHTLVI